jgi:hypothetical protein
MYSVVAHDRHAERRVEPFHETPTASSATPSPSMVAQQRQTIRARHRPAGLFLEIA